MQLILFLMREKIKAIISSKEVLIITPAKISSCQTIFPFEMLVNELTLLRFMERKLSEICIRRIESS